ncbi:hypothetical protein PAI11_07550 [Patulibacter medicamentivorans]|uniref:Uncharacterized protein n=1 Tax=Patulibacter medicamentivorans TaxID=1097667 RepID=H0E1U3_9ACTN|nr:hypothetical protein [Patulibacter medicamentivorans]EHN12335.1 hypothetical protein PAI11_07550 [Patulibacter medicamentivorans]
MRPGANVRRTLLAAALAVLMVGCGDERPATPALPGTERSDGGDAAADPEVVAGDRAFDAAGVAAAEQLARADGDDAWALPDALQGPMDRLWNERRGAYVSPDGRISTRLNAEMLRIHAAAALTEHDGPARHDDRIAGLVAFLTGPAYLASTDGLRFGDSRHNTVHAPGWRQSDSPTVNQHPSIDATVARALRIAWLARERIGLPERDRQAIRATVVAVASSATFRAPSRLLNQINWNADLYGAAATVGDDPRLLRDDYRQQLAWFAEHAHRPVHAGRTPNLSDGNGFHYRPDVRASDPVDRTDTVEYANVVLGALRYYGQALRAGMRPLRPEQLETLREWATHTVDADWTPSGYLNWETGKGQSRIHLRQYWALALDGAVMALRGGSSIIGRSPAEADLLLSRGVRLFRQWAADADTILLPATTFGFRSSFENVRSNRVTATVRLAATLADWAAGCACDGRLPGPDRSLAPLKVDLDPGFGRLTVNGPRYATAIAPPTSVPTGGGLEPAWILDADAAPLGALGGGGDGSLGLEVSRAGEPLLDTQPGERAPDANLRLRPLPGSADRFAGVVRNGRVRVDVRHRFTRDAIVTRYVIVPGGRVDVALRLPANGRAGTVRCRPVRRHGRPEDVPGCPAGSEYLVHTSSGAEMAVELGGLPAGARVTLHRPAVRSMLPRPGIQATVRFPVRRRTVIERVLRPVDR